jgi:glycogen operon protein
VSHDRRHNEANGEDNRDGSGTNLSRNCGVEGDTDDAAVLARRARLQRVLLGALLLSQGTPMLLAGDEIGHGQRGNNNAYCQDNETTWLDWTRADLGLQRHVQRLLALRRDAAPLRSNRWWPSSSGAAGTNTLRWLTPDGPDMQPEDWTRRGRHALAILFDAAVGEPAWLVLVNADTQAGDGDVEFTIPPGVWQLELGSDNDDGEPRRLDAVETLAPSSLWLARRTG